MNFEGLPRLSELTFLEVVHDQFLVGRHSCKFARIPANTTATIRLPNAKTDAITEGGKKLASSDDFKNVRADGKAVKLDVGSGVYVFEWAVEK